MGTVLHINDLDKRYGPQVIFEKASVAIGLEHKIGVIGRNGAGKSTLCKIILGEEEADHGQVVESSELRLSYLEQHDPFQPDESVLGFLMRYTGKEDWQCGKLAGRFQMKGKMLEQTIGSLSGGFQTRVKLTAMLLRDPNFLILDEPSNYLDLKTLILLENFLRDFNGGFMIVSHDREFLKRTCQCTMEVERGGISLYPGSVEEFLEYQEQQHELAERHNENVEAEQKRLQRFVDRFRAKATKAAQAKSKMKQIERLEKIEIAHPIRSVRIRIPKVEVKGGVALNVKDLAIGYPGTTVADDVHLDIDRGRRVAILGDNGEGKTTFLRTIANELPKLAGEFKWGHGLKPAYYAQHVYASMNPEDDIESYLIKRAAPGVTKQEILNMAGSFLFGGDIVKKNVTVLSGGERARLCLAGLLLSKNPVLLLDEPTNHLDFDTVEALGYALSDYTGTIFFTSHDRTFVSLVADQILEVKDRKIRLYPGNYESYVFALEEMCREDETNGVAVPGKEAKGDKRNDYQKQKERKSRLRKLKNQVKEFDERMTLLGIEKDGILKHFEKNPTAYSQQHTLRLNVLETDLAETEAKWLQATEEIEGLEAEL
ncbi:MAG: ABC-F family ATP-binding cassette domain-containing protein [Planctomycetota bacterium]|nr:ABC-F family ATP-binding cassette domain-containing protein [Planctomycetota bacterium]